MLFSTKSRAYAAAAATILPAIADSRGAAGTGALAVAAVCAAEAAATAIGLTVYQLWWSCLPGVTQVLQQKKIISK